MPKSKDAFRTISEVAEWLDTPAHVLRFWESKFTQVKPVKRAGGRRYYRPADMQLLGGIKKLLHDDGLTIKGAQKLLREHGVKHVAELSQPLEDDLIDDVKIEEAAYEPNAQAHVEEPATVLSFPSRTEETSAPETVTPELAEETSAPPVQSVEDTPSVPAPTVALSTPTAETETPVVETKVDAAETPSFDFSTSSKDAPVDTAEPEDTVEVETTAPEMPVVVEPAPTAAPLVETPMAQTQPLVQPPAPNMPLEDVAAHGDSPTAPEQTEEQENAQAFGSDALPAFLRRSVPAKEHTSETGEEEASPSAPVNVPVDTADAAPEKVTINPVAHLEPIETETPAAASETHAEDTAEQTMPSESIAPTTPTQPIFSRAMASTEDAPTPPAPIQPVTEAAEIKTESAEEPEQVEATAPDVPTAAPKIAVDVPSLVKVAPELSSFTAPPGVLSSVPKATGVSAELAASMASKLADLRALRDRMQNH